MDKLSPQQRHANMAAIRSKNTKPELIVRKGLWKRGFRYRLNHKRLPGNHIWLQNHTRCLMADGRGKMDRGIPYPQLDEEDMQMPMAAEDECL